MKVIRQNLHRLDKSDQLLVRLLATTGMRRGEAFEIDREQRENGIRFCVIGTKTPQSLRRVPFPADLLPYLPKKITGQLIPGRMDTAGKRLREWLTDIGITDPDKAPMHSFRHRAAQRMRAAGVPEDVREAIGGWANGKKKKVSGEVRQQKTRRGLSALRVKRQSTQSDFSGPCERRSCPTEDRLAVFDRNSRQHIGCGIRKRGSRVRYTERAGIRLPCPRLLCSPLYFQLSAVRNATSTRQITTGRPGLIVSVVSTR